MGDNRCDLVFRVILIGYNSVGKSTMMRKYAGGDLPNVISTIGVNWSSKVVEWEGKKVKLQLWTTAKQERHSSLAAQSCSKADAVVFVYDVTKMETFSGISQWHESLGVCTRAEVVLVANKIDLMDRRVVSAEMGRSKAESFCGEGVPYFETCALNGTNVEEVFNHLLTKFVNKRSESGSFQSSTIISLEAKPDQEKSTRTCC